MKNIFIIAFVFAAVAYGESVIPFEAGKTNEVGPGLKIYVESINTTNLYDIVLFEYDPLDTLKRTGYSKHATYDTSNPNVLTLNLHDVTLKQISKDGIEQTIKAKLYPIRIETSVTRIRKQHRTSKVSLRADFREWHDTNYRVEKGVEFKTGESKIVRELDDQGNAKKIIYYDDGVTLSRYSEVFRNSTNNIITQKSFDASGALVRWSDGLWVEGKYVWLKQYSAEGKLTLQTKYKYDAKGRTLEQKFYDSNDALLNGHECEYDDKNNSSSEMLLKSDGSLDFRNIEHRYSDDGLKIESTRYWKGKEYEISKYEYVNGNCTTETLIAPDGKVFYKTTTDYSKNGTREVRRNFKPNKETGELELVEVTRSNIKY